MTGLWKESDVPYKNWKYAGFQDLMDKPENYDLGIENKQYTPQLCEMCQIIKARFVHILKHHKYPHDLKVCSSCAEKMEEDSKRPKEREKISERRLDIRIRMLGEDWEISQNKNQYIRYLGYFVVVFEYDDGNWGFSIGSIGDNNGSPASEKYEDEFEAQEAGCDALLENAGLVVTC